MWMFANKHNGKNNGKKQTKPDQEKKVKSLGVTNQVLVQGGIPKQILSPILRTEMNSWPSRARP